MEITYRIGIASLLVSLLVILRFFEHSLFYDPLIDFYKSDYLHNTIPDFITWKLLANIALRFWINSGISLAIMYSVFMDKSILKFSFLLYVLLFAFCFPGITFLILTIENENFTVLFMSEGF